jgi:hypothetical protein
MTSFVALLLSALCAVSGYAALMPVTFDPAGGTIQSPALVLLTNHNSTGVIFYTTDGSDPRDVFGGVVPTARIYEPPTANTPALTFPLSINRPMIVTARVKSGTNWSDAAVAAFSVDQDFSKLLFTEILFHSPPTPTNFDLGPLEFVELKNTGSKTLDLSGLELRNLITTRTRGLHHTFPTGSVVGAGQFMIIAITNAIFEAYYPGVPLAGCFNGPERGLNHEREELALRATNGAVAALARWNTHAPWQVAADDHGYFKGEAGFSLVRTNLDLAIDPRDFRTWNASAARFGSPGADDPPAYRPPIKINELLTRPGSEDKDTVELFNPTAAPVDLTGWWLSDQRNWPFRFKMPAGTIIPAQGFKVFTEDDFNAGTNGFSFDGSGERCYIFSADTNGLLTGYSDGLQYAGSERDVSFGRHTSSTGEKFIIPESARTFGSNNAGPAARLLIISEVLYSADTTNANFIELHNTSNLPLPLLDGWAIGDSQAVEFSQLVYFPTNTILPANGHLLIISGDTNAFRTNYNVPNDVPIFAFFLPSFRDFDGGKMLRIYRTAPGGGSPIVMDEMPYQSHTPWPVEAAGGGASIERLGDTPFGFDPINWRANPQPTPGRANRANLPPQVWAGGARTVFVNRPTTIAGIVCDDLWPATTLTSWWTQISGPAPVIFTSNALANVTATFIEAGQYTLRLTATDGAFTSTNDIFVEALLRGFDLWRGTNFTTAELSNTSISGSSADPDSDGLSNADEYFFATNPKLADSPHRLQVEVTNQWVKVSWTERAEVPDISVALELAYSINGPWFGASGLFERTTSPGTIPGTIQVICLSRLPINAEASQFARLSRTLLP